jgi:hypothetical protein
MIGLHFKFSSAAIFAFTQGKLEFSSAFLGELEGEDQIEIEVGGVDIRLCGRKVKSCVCLKCVDE